MIRGPAPVRSRRSPTAGHGAATRPPSPASDPEAGLAMQHTTGGLFPSAEAPGDGVPPVRSAVSPPPPCAPPSPPNLHPSAPASRSISSQRGGVCGGAGRSAVGLAVSFLAGLAAAAAAAAICSMNASGGGGGVAGRETAGEQGDGEEEEKGWGKEWGQGETLSNRKGVSEPGGMARDELAWLTKGELGG